MNIRCLLSRSILLPLASSVLLVPTAHAQLFPPRAPWQSAAVETIGGVTTFTFGAQLPNCHWIETSDLVVNGPQFNLRVAEMIGDICLFCLCHVLQTNSIVLGKLPPGEYVFQATAFPSEPFPSPFPGEQVVYRQTFTVTAPPAPTLTLTRAGDKLRLQVHAAPAAEVTLLASDDLLRWTALGTGTPTLGPVSLAVEPTEKFRFYRARLADGSINLLVPDTL